LKHTKAACSWLNWGDRGDLCDHSFSPLPAAKEVPSDTLLDSTLEERCVLRYGNDGFRYCSTISAVDETSTLLRHLKAVLDARIPGSVVELGVFEGGMTSFIQQQLVLRKEEREYHIYDSFEGFPDQSKEGQDGIAQAGMFNGSMAKVYENCAQAGVPPPAIHKGFFAQIPDSEYPAEIAFAFLDSDLYQSVMDSLVRVWPRVVPGGRVLIHDINSKRFPAGRRAVEDFLKNLPGYGAVALENAWHCPCGVGVVVKHVAGFEGRLDL